MTIITTTNVSQHKEEPFLHFSRQDVLLSANTFIVYLKLILVSSHKCNELLCFLLCIISPTQIH